MYIDIVYAVINLTLTKMFRDSFRIHWVICLNWTLFPAAPAGWGCYV